MALGYLIVILLFTAPIWMWGLIFLFLKKWNDRPSGLSPEEEQRIWEETLHGG